MSASKLKAKAPELVKQGKIKAVLYGVSGVGKTTLAHLIAYTLESPLKTTSGVAIERAGDLAAILTNLEPNTILFIENIENIFGVLAVGRNR